MDFIVIELGIPKSMAILPFKGILGSAFLKEQTIIVDNNYRFLWLSEPLRKNQM